MSLAFCWAVPRSVSTALARSFIQLAAVDVVHEPFTESFYLGPIRGSSRYGNPTNETEGMPGGVIDDLLRRAAEAERSERLVFIKELAFQGEPFVPDALLARARHLFVMRDPQRVFPSLVKLKPDFSEAEFGFTSLARVVERLDSLGLEVRGVDGDELQSSTEAALRAACSWVGVKFDPSMLEWSDGRIREWTPDEAQSQVPWHRTLEASTGFVRTKHTPVEPSPRQRKIIAQAVEIYEGLQARSLVRCHV